MPTTIDLGKVKLAYKGTWSNSTSYEANDLVYSNSALWICTTAYSATSNNRYAPGLIDRTTAYGPQFNALKNPLDTFQLQKIQVSVPVGYKFFIDGRRNPPYASGTVTPAYSTITLVRGQTYRFQTYHSTMTGVNFRFCTSTDGTTYSSGVTVVGTPGFSGSYVQITVPFDAPSTLYYKQDTVATIADSSYFTVVDPWQGYQTWELVSEGLAWKGSYNNSTQYYRNDLVEYSGTVYQAKADTLGIRPSMVMQNVTALTNPPTGRNVWTIFSATNKSRDPGNGAWLPNHGPIDWPYPHHSNNNPAWYWNIQWISKSGRVYSSGSGSSYSNAWGDSNNTNSNQAMEARFVFTDWFRSRDSLPRTTNTTSGNILDYQQRRTGFTNDFYGRNLHVTPHGQQPRCIQIDGGHDGRIYLFDDGSVHTAGYGSQGQLGNGLTNASTYGPIPVHGFENVRIKKVARASTGAQDSSTHFMALDEEGHVWTWGYNTAGQLGTGDNTNRYAPYRIAKEWFNNQRIVDIACSGTSGSSYARTESGELWSWGQNNTGQLGLGDTTNRWRPNKITAFDYQTNGGIIKWQVCGDSTTASFFVLDAAGYMWHAGYNGYGQAGTADTTQHNTLTRSSVAPTAGTMTNFWACHANGYTMVWQRVTNGNTYFCGYNASGYYHSGVSGSNVSLSTPTLVANVVNLKQVWCVTDYSSTLRTVWFTDKAEMWAQGYLNYVWNGNNQAGSPSTIEDGANYKPYRMSLPAGTRIEQVWFSSDDQGSSQYGPHLLALGDNGQVFYTGMNWYGYSTGQNWISGNRWSNQGSHRCFVAITKGR